MNKSDLDYIYDVVCPVCGSKPSYRITGINSDGLIVSHSEELYCPHPELEDLIHLREEQWRVNQSE